MLGLRLLGCVALRQLNELIARGLSYWNGRVQLCNRALLRVFKILRRWRNDWIKGKLKVD